MSWKTEWEYLTGYLKITVRAKDIKNNYRTFYFICYVASLFSSADSRLSYLEEATRGIAHLRDLCFPEIIDVKRVDEV